MTHEIIYEKHIPTQDEGVCQQCGKDALDHYWMCECGTISGNGICGINMQNHVKQHEHSKRTTTA